MNWTRARDVTLFLLRVVAGLLFFQAGALKMFGWFGGMPPGVAMTPLVWTAAIIEVGGGIALMLGLFTRPVAFVCSGEMAVAYFKFHQPGGFWPIQNHGEEAVLLCFLFLFLWANGAGRWSLDTLIQNRRSPVRA
jgi:putative oxidoreductase